MLSRLENSMWKPIQGYEGYYEVSDSGEVRSLDRYVLETRGKHTGTQKLLKGRKMKLTENNYLVVNLRKNNTSYVVPVHVLVAKTFIPNPDIFANPLLLNSAVG